MLMILEIIQAIENDDERAKVEQIFHQHYKHMMAKSMSILNNYHDAQDAVQETFRCISENFYKNSILGKINGKKSRRTLPLG